MKSIFDFKEYIETYKIEMKANSLCAEVCFPKNIYIHGYDVVVNDETVINHKHEYDIDLPQLNYHQRFYLEDADIEVYINDLIRTSSNSIKYTCYDLHIPKDKNEYDKLKEECEKKNKELIKLYKESKPVGAICTPSFSESNKPEKKKGFFSGLFSR